LKKIKVASINLILIACVVFHLTGCFPIVQEEFVSPTWKGQLISAQTLKPLSGVKIEDETTGKSTTSNSQGGFLIPAQTQSLHFKVPGYMAFKDYQLNISGKTFSTLKVLTEVTNTPNREQQSDLGVLIIDTKPDQIFDYAELGLVSSEPDDLLVNECVDDNLDSVMKLTNAIYKAKLTMENHAGLDSEKARATINNQVGLVSFYWKDSWRVCRPKTTQGRAELEKQRKLVLQNLNKLSH